MTKLLTKNDILKAVDTDYVDVDVPEWGGTVRVASMSGSARDQFEASVLKNGETDLTNIRAKMVSACLTDENGNLLFNEKDVKELGKKSAKALDRVFSEAQKLNGISDKDVDELAKN